MNNEMQFMPDPDRSAVGQQLEPIEEPLDEMILDDVSEAPSTIPTRRAGRPKKNH